MRTIPVGRQPLPSSARLSNAWVLEAVLNELGNGIHRTLAESSGLTHHSTGNTLHTSHGRLCSAATAATALSSAALAASAFSSGGTATGARFPRRGFPASAFAARRRLATPTTGRLSARRFARAGTLSAARALPSAALASAATTLARAALATSTLASRGSGPRPLSATS
jgi:hypothetical protein